MGAAASAPAARAPALLPTPHFPSAVAGRAGTPPSEPRRMFRRQIGVRHPAIIGVENRTDRLRTANAATSHAGTRSTVPGSVARHPDSRHGCATARRALTRSARALMTDSDRSAVETNRTCPKYRRAAAGTESAGLVVTSPSLAAAAIGATQHPVDGDPHRSPRIAMS